VKATIDRVIMNMSWVTIEVPDVLAQLPPAERDSLIQAGLKDAQRAMPQASDRISRQLLLELRHGR
jgi:hypothetical protein